MTIHLILAILGSLFFFVFSHQMMKAMRKMKLYTKLEQSKEAHSFYLSAVLWGTYAFICFMLALSGFGIL
jgi:hypothetical protein